MTTLTLSPAAYLIALDSIANAWPFRGYGVVADVVDTVRTRMGYSAESLAAYGLDQATRWLAPTARHYVWIQDLHGSLEIGRGYGAWYGLFPKAQQGA